MGLNASRQGREEICRGSCSVLIDMFSLKSNNRAMFEIQPYYTDDGKIPFAKWHDALRDYKARAAIDRRLFRMTQGNFGDCKPCQDGVWELRVDVGQGYRVYYARQGQAVVLLLCGGDKRTQQADIAKACDYWHDWKTRHYVLGDTP